MKTCIMLFMAFFFLFAIQVPAYAQESIIIRIPSSDEEETESEDSDEPDISLEEESVTIHIPSSGEEETENEDSDDSDISSAEESVIIRVPSSEGETESEDSDEPCTLSVQGPVNFDDLTAPCNLSAEELAPVLKGLSEYAEEFLAAEEKYGVNAVFLASLAAFESGWGSHCFRENNLFGWGRKEFYSKEECIDFVARRISEWYLAEGGKYYNGLGLGGINACYNGSAVWYDCMLGMMQGMSARLRPLGPVEIASL
ncbi:MAG TPA: glucosaminidase domain-containing protein [Oscillospiraceae bacterium]|nr:glucosaminidase domain-containing protein [Oscillospiraceae bacterium]HRW56210.1 glucosaminidase domain-containing protein [Oscillospiraceae bacterium]